MTSTGRPRAKLDADKPVIPNGRNLICNARFLRNKISEISQFLNDHSVHILAVSETWLGPKVTNNLILIKGVQPPYRYDRNEFEGGVCIYVATKFRVAVVRTWNVLAVTENKFGKKCFRIIMNIAPSS